MFEDKARYKKEDRLWFQKELDGAWGPDPEAKCRLHTNVVRI